MTGALVVGIAGGTGSGKTTVAERIAAAFSEREVVVIQHDSYYRPRPDLEPEARDRLNFDHPDLDHALLIAQLVSLRAGRAVEVPIYDYVTHLRRPETRRVESAPVVLLEGILVFVDADLRRMLDVKLFVDTDADIRMLRRIRRDMEERGRSFEQVREQYYEYGAPPCTCSSSSRASAGQT